MLTALKDVDPYNMVVNMGIALVDHATSGTVKKSRGTMKLGEISKKV